MRVSTVLALLGVAVLAVLAGVSDAAKSPPLGKPSYVFVQLQLVELGKIDGVEQAFHADFYMLTYWQAPNVAKPDGTMWKEDDDLTADDCKNNFWQPQLEFINQRAETTRLVDEPFSFTNTQDVMDADIDFSSLNGWQPDPNMLWIVEDQRYQNDFTTPLAMQDFPYDVQFMEFLVESFWTRSTDAQVALDDFSVIIVWGNPGFLPKIVPPTMPDIIGWTYEEAAMFNSDILYAYNAATYNRLTVRLKLKRIPDYYLNKIVSGAMLLVYMCIWVFALAVDEADRMMGTLQIFAGLITFLFVATQDTPKVPYQTRLDVFMMWSFFVVFFILFIHGTLYYWRECDVEEELEEQKEEEKKKKREAKEKQAGVELAPRDGLSAGAVQPAGGVHSVQVGGHAQAAPPEEHEVSDEWRLREHSWREWSLVKWFRGLHLTRKFDAVFVPLLLISYSVGCGVILNRPVHEVNIHDPNAA